MQRISSHKELQWLQFDLFSDCKKLIHGVFTRRGGKSLAAFHSLNTGFSSGDNREAIVQNRTLIKEALDLSHLDWGYLVHGAEFRFGKIEEDTELEQPTRELADGLLSQISGLGLGITHADCQAAIFYDPFLHALAVVHCGWRGNVQNIYAKTVQAMKRSFGTKAENLLVGISPSLGPEFSEFVNYENEFPGSFINFQTKPFYFNLWELSRWQLEECGVLPHHIEIAGLCTYSSSEDWFSYRRDKVTGRNATIAALH
jgi:polyphenol oxidase